MTRSSKNIPIWLPVASVSSGQSFAFWSGRITRACRRQEMLCFGKDFGKGLQLINILRDFPLDLQAGRSYLPVANPEEIALKPALGRREWERWRQRAFAYLEEAWKYVIAVRPWRVRFACALPVFIGMRTLILLGDAPENQLGIKVSRKEVRHLMVWAAGVALFRFLEPAAYRKIFRR